MSLTVRPYYRPSPIARMMDRWFDEALAPLSERFSEDTLSLPMDVQATERGYTVSAAVPGLKAEDLTIEVLGNTASSRAPSVSPRNLTARRSRPTSSRAY